MTANAPIADIRRKRHIGRQIGDCTFLMDVNHSMLNPPRQAQPFERLEFIDGLRGIAAAIVLLSHLLEVIARDFSREFWAATLDHPVLDFIGLGRVGVIAFFCVSGFVIPFSLTPRGGLRRFAISRFFRLYPAYWFSILLALSLAAVLGQPFPNLRVVLANLTMVQAGLGQPDLISVFWTLFYELLFYAGCAALFFCGLLDRSAVVLTVALSMIAAAIAASVARFLLGVGLPVGIPLYLAVMFFGTLYRHAVLRQDALAMRSWPSLLAAISAAAPIVAYFGFAHATKPDRPWADLIALYLGFALFFASFKWRGWFARPIMVWLGAISYALYLIHPLGMQLARHAMSMSDAEIIRLLILLAGIPLSMLGAHAIGVLLERPAINIGKRIAHSR